MRTQVASPRRHALRATPAQMRVLERAASAAPASGVVDADALLRFTGRLQRRWQDVHIDTIAAELASDPWNRRV